MEHEGYTILQAKQTGGKAGKGHNKTSTLQIMKSGENIIIKQIKFDIINGQKMLSEPIEKAKKYIDELNKKL